MRCSSLNWNTDGLLNEDYRLHALPDACTYVVFDQLDKRIAGGSKLRAESEEFNLGRQSHFIHSFRRATGYTPGKYAKKYDV